MQGRNIDVRAASLEQRLGPSRTDAGYALVNFFAIEPLGLDRRGHHRPITVGKVDRSAAMKKTPLGKFWRNGPDAIVSSATCGPP